MLAILMNLGFAGQDPTVQNIRHYDFTFTTQAFSTGGQTWFNRLKGRIVGFINPNFQGF